LNLTQVET